MRSRKTSQDQLAEVARRRLELLSAELAGIRTEQPGEPPAEPQAEPPPGPSPGPPAGPVARRSEPPAARRSEPPAERSVRTDELGVEGLVGPSVPHPTDRSTGSTRDQHVEPRVPGAPVGAAAGRHAHRSVGIAGRLSGWVRDRLPPTLQGGASLSVAHLAVVAAALVAGVLATVWWVSSSDDGGAGSAIPAAATPSALVSVPPTADGPSPPTAASSPAATAQGAGASSTAPAATASSSVVVDVAGKVRRPGIATLPLGARVVDALEAAGGARRGVRLGSLNLARVLTDGEQIVVGMPAPQGVAAPAASAPTSTSGSTGGGTGVPLVNINTAGQAELEELPGIGPVTAQAILAFRSERGTFSSVDELLEVSGIGDATLADMAPFVTL